jgi:signal transduction histidine kinase
MAEVGLRGIPVPGWIQAGSPLKAQEVTRYFLPGNFRELPGSLWREARYQMVFDDGMVVTSFPGRELEEYTRFFQILLILELFLLFQSWRRGRRHVARTLKPLTDLAEKARSLRSLAGTISSIDASRLDQRIRMDTGQKELDDLAAAINSMLNRIDEAYRLQVRFVSDASHELRTPISVIQGYASLLDRWGKDDPETLQEAISAIRSESDNMKDLVEQLLFLARGDNDTMTLYPETFDGVQLVEEVAQEARMVDPNHQFLTKDSGPVMMEADRQLIKQALRILVDNSTKYTDPGGDIWIYASLDGKKVQLTVQDTGIGIDPEQLPYIFDRFYRVEESRARATGGSGLGLSIMKWIVERHGGTIEVVSRKDFGTRTRLQFPPLENSTQ